MTTVLAIDPGNTESGWALIDAKTREPLRFGKTENHALREMVQSELKADHYAIEMVASYGMAVGKDVFETCVWVGRFQERVSGDARLVYRRPVKMHFCHSAKAKDSNVTQALVDRFASGCSNHGKGTKAAPGWFYGFKSDVWSAYALAVYVADELEGHDGDPNI